jgi:hypothetical protein
MDLFAIQPNAKPFRIYCIYHKFLTEEAYKDLSECYIRDYVRFIGVNAQIKKTIPSSLKEYCFEERFLANYDPFLQFNRFCESSVFYHMYKNQELLLDPFEYVGCVQYDMVLQNSMFETITNELEKHNNQPNILFYHYIDNTAKHLFNPYSVEVMDPVTHERKIVVESMMYAEWTQIIQLYNTIFKTRHTLQDILESQFPLYHTFVLHKTMFQKMMFFATFAIPRIFEMLHFNTRHLPYHIERCHGLFLLFQKLEGHLPTWILLPGIDHRSDLKDPWQECQK